jgi:dihydroorotate dehydrogenase (fumarate)
MIDVTTAYMGLKLRNPLVASSSPLTLDLDNIRRMEDAGAAAIVMHSLFEEQIALERRQRRRILGFGTSLDDSLSDVPDLTVIFLPDVTDYNRGPDAYLEHLHRAKQAVRIPVIASLNGSSRGNWTKYASGMEEAGADAIELNTYYLPAEVEVTSAEVERRYFDLVKQVKSTVTIPVAVKLNPYFSALANVARRLNLAGAEALVLFNRFYQPDFDLERLEVLPNLALSGSEELLLRLHWVAILYAQLKADLAVTGGVHSAQDVVKAIMAGAQVAMMTSALLKNGIDHFRKVLADLSQWMEEHGYESIGEMRGSMALRSIADTSAFERANYLRVLSSSSLRPPKKE